MNNLLLYCGLVDARISASDKDLPVLRTYLWKYTRVKVSQFINHALFSLLIVRFETQTNLLLFHVSQITTNTKHGI